MRNRPPSRSDAAGRAAPARTLARRPPRPAPTRPKADEAPPQERAPNRMDWADPLTEEEREALEAGWGFVE
ncbi:hypothetical protein ACRBEV_20940 [Methylobacterium phyllosphaerae]